MGALVWQIRALDGFENTADNAAGALPAIFAQGGLEGAGDTDRLRTVFGTLAFYRAREPGGADGDR
jgi:hypothetical protein